MIARCPKLQERWREATHTEITGGIKGFRCILSDEERIRDGWSAGHGMGVQYQEDWSTEMQSCIGWE
jgi:hypothetical protein